MCHFSNSVVGRWNSKPTHDEVFCVNCKYVCVCVFAFMYACMCLSYKPTRDEVACVNCMYVCVCVCVCGCMYACACVCMYACMYVCMHVCVYYIKLPAMLSHVSTVCMHVCMYVCMCISVWMHVCMHACMCVLYKAACDAVSCINCMYVCRYVCMCMYIYTYTHTHTYMYIYTHIWKIVSDKCIYICAQMGHTSAVCGLHVLGSRNAHSIVTLCRDGRVCTWSPTKLTVCVYKHSYECLCMYACMHVCRVCTWSPIKLTVCVFVYVYMCVCVCRCVCVCVYT
jgi:hypothetical protein